MAQRGDVADEFLDRRAFAYISADGSLEDLSPNP
jgi:hypothetical protein